MTLFSEKVLISNRCIRGLMPNLIKKSWTDSIPEVDNFKKKGLATPEKMRRRKINFEKLLVHAGNKPRPLW